MTTLVSGGAMPVGAIIAFGGAIADIPAGFLLCDGSLLNRNDFSDLFATIGENWGTDTVTDFRLPTTQGIILRGQDNGSGLDPEAATRTALNTGASSGDAVGSFQNWRVESHTHDFNLVGTNGPSAINGVQFGSYTSPNPSNYTGNRLVYGSDDQIANLSQPVNRGVTAANGNSNFNDASPNSNAEATPRSWQIITRNTYNPVLAQTVGQNVYVNYIIKF